MTEDAKGYHLKFKQAILQNSDEKIDFKKACKEWTHTNYLHKESSKCICTKDIYDCFTIKHKSGKVLEPIGKDCIKHISDNNGDINISLDKAIKHCNNIKNIENLKNIKENEQYCNICYSTKKKIVEMLYTKDNENWFNMPYVFCNKCSKLIEHQQDNKNVLIKTIKFYRKIKKELKIKKPMNVIKPLNEAIAKEKEEEKKRKQIEYTDFLGDKIIKFGMFKNERYKNVVNKKRFKSWFEFMLTKQEFIDNNLNNTLIQYCKNRIDGLNFEIN